VTCISCEAVTWLVFPFPQSPLHIGWNVANGGECDLEVRFENEGWTAQGTLGTDRAQFVMRLSATLIVQQFMLFRHMDEPDLWLGRDRSGQWEEIDLALRPDLDGCTDIELRMNPFPTSASMNAFHCSIRTLRRSRLRW